METHFLSRFTPSLMTSEALESIFVQREDLLQTILERIGTSALTSVKQNTLLVGPRGIGKTHLISLIYYRLQVVEELKGHILTAWLREEEWGITCFRDFLLRILRALLSQNGEDQALEQRLASIYAPETGHAESAAFNLIKEIVGQRTLVILSENFDGLIQELGSLGGMQLFRFLRESGFCCLVTTTPGPVARTLPPGSPFRQDFFYIQPLQELSFKDAILLLSRIAQYQGSKELGSLIATPRGRARVRALRYLAGGNHRAYVIFAPLLTCESLNELLKPLLQTIDDLTPYYNSRIATLSLEQRKIIEYVCESRHPVQTAEVARSCFLIPTTASAQLQALCKMGYLKSFRIGDAGFYELHEPLMRLSFEVKKHRGRPIGLLLDFLRLWYSPAELKQKVAMLPGESAIERNYMPPLQVLEQKWEDPRISECCREYNAAVQRDNYDHALQAAEELAALRGLKQDFLAIASCLIHLNQCEQAVAVYDKMIDSYPPDASLWQLRAWTLNRIGQSEEALSSCEKSIELDPRAGRSWCERASILASLGRFNEALDSCDEAIRLSDTDSLPYTIRGRVLADLDLFEEAFTAFSKAVDLEPQNSKARIHLCAALIELNRFDEALKQAQRSLELSSGEPEAWVVMGSVLTSLGHRDESLYAFNKAISLGEDSAFVHYKVVEILLSQARWREGAICLDKALGQYAYSENPNVGDTKTLIRCLFQNLGDPKALNLSIRLLLLIYGKHRMLSAFGKGLIECIPEVVSPSNLSDEDASLWWDSWKTTAGSFPEFQLPLRLLDSALRYRRTRDLRIFMDLSQEERTLLEALVGVNIEAIA